MLTVARTPDSSGRGARRRGFPCAWPSQASADERVAVARGGGARCRRGHHSPASTSSRCPRPTSPGNETSEPRFFVLYDPAVGFATRGGWIIPGGGPLRGSAADCRWRTCRVWPQKPELARLLRRTQHHRFGCGLLPPCDGCLDVAARWCCSASSPTPCGSRRDCCTSRCRHRWASGPGSDPKQRRGC